MTMQLVDRRFLRFFAAVVVFVPLLLLIDTAGVAAQLALGAATAGLLWLFARDSTIERRQIITAIVIASIGECLLSVGFGLYTYRNALIPLYVPFGHGVLYLLSVESAQQHALRRIAPAITRGVLVCGSAGAILSLAFFRDQWGLLWWLIAAALVMRSRNQLLLSVSFLYAMALELLGTAVGNWRWAAEVPIVGLHSANPPSGVGLLYVLLDLVTVAVCSTVALTPVERPATRRASAGRAGATFLHESNSSY